MGHELKLSQSDATSLSLPHWWVLHIQGTCECDYSDYPHYAPAAQRHCHQEAKLHSAQHQYLQTRSISPSHTTRD